MKYPSEHKKTTIYFVSEQLAKMVYGELMSSMKKRVREQRDDIRDKLKREFSNKWDDGFSCGLECREGGNDQKKSSPVSEKKITQYHSSEKLALMCWEEILFSLENLVRDFRGEMVGLLAGELNKKYLDGWYCAKYAILEEIQCIICKNALGEELTRRVSALMKWFE